MDFFREWAFSLCFASVIGGILNMMLPSGSNQKIFKTILCMFFLCVIAGPIYENNLPENIFDFIKNNNLITEDSENEFNKNSLEYIEQRIKEDTTEIIKNEGLEIKDILIKINILENGSIDIDKFVLKLNHAENADKLAETIKEKTGLLPEIIISEDN